MPDKIIGGSPALRRLRSALPHLASDPKPIVIVGETGVGKSLLASRIHALSPFKSVSAETINFSTMSERDQRVAVLGGGPPELTTTRKSLLEYPTTVALKHVDCASHYLQEQLAAFLIGKKIVRPGSCEMRLLNCRVVFIFQESPSDLSRRGLLVSSLSSLILQCRTIHLPPLRKRTEDIPILAEHFLQHSVACSKGPSESQIKLTTDLLDFLVRQRWEENVLQLKAFVASLVTPSFESLLSQHERIEIAKIALMIDEGKEFSLKQSLARIEACVVSRALAKFAGCQSRTAQQLGTTDRSIRHLQETLMRMIVVAFSSSLLQALLECADKLCDLPSLC